MKKAKQLKNVKKVSKNVFGEARRIAMIENLMHDDHGLVIIGKREDPPGF